MGVRDESQRGKSRFLSNTAALGVSMVATAVLTLVQVKVLSAFLAPRDFGLFAALRGFSLLIAMLAANGFPQLLVRFLPYHESKRQRQAAFGLSAVCFLVPLLLLAVLFLVAESGREIFFRFARGVALSPELLVWFYATTLGVMLKLIVYGGLNGLRRFPSQVAIEVAALAVQVTWMVVWRENLSMVRLFMILAVTSIGAGVVGLPWYFGRLARDTAGGERAGVGGEGDAPARYREYWLGATGLSLVAIAFSDVDRYVLSQVLTLELLSQFHVASRVLRLINRFLSVPVLAFQPEVTRLGAEGRDHTIAASTGVFVKLGTTVAMFTTVGVLVLAPEIVRVVATAQYDPAVPLLRILVLSLPLTTLTAPLTAVMKALDQVRRALYCDLAWAIAYVGLLVWLGRWSGLLGTGIALVVACLVQASLAVAFSGTRPAFAMGVLGRAAVCSIAAFAPLFVASLVLPGGAVALAVKGVLLVAALLLLRPLCGVLAVFTAEERGVLRSAMESRGLGALARRII